MFEFKNRFLYTVAPIDGGGAGGSGASTISNASYVINYPFNNYYDFQSGGITQNYVFFVGDTGFKSIAYYENITDNNVQSSPLLIGLNGNPAPGTSNLRTWINLNAAKNFIITVIRKYTVQGRNKDEVFWYDSLGELYSDTLYDYVILQKAVPVTFYGVNGSPTGSLTPNSNTSILSSDIVSFSKAQNRGDEVLSVWTVFKTDPAGSFADIAATLGVDYNLISGTLSSDNIQIQFINGALNFSVKNTAGGYTFNNNPYKTFVGSSTNQDTSVYNFILLNPTATYEILIPRINITLSVPAASLLKTIPFETYQNQLIDVSPVLDIPSGYWKKIIGSSSSLLTKSDLDWRTEISNTCNVTLEVRDSITNNLLISVPGLNDSTIRIPIISTYTLKYITQIK